MRTKNENSQRGRVLSLSFPIFHSIPLFIAPYYPHSSQPINNYQKILPLSMRVSDTSRTDFAERRLFRVAGRYHNQ